MFGHPKVHVLNNFRLWVEQGLPTEAGEMYSVECCPYPIPPETDVARVASFEDVCEAAVDHNKEGAEGIQILDARSPGRFSGKADEPRPGLFVRPHAGRHQHSPSTAVLDAATKAFLPADKLQAPVPQQGNRPFQAHHIELRDRRHGLRPRDGAGRGPDWIPGLEESLRWELDVSSPDMPPCFPPPSR